MTKHRLDDKGGSRQADAEIEVTPEMVRAGAYRLRYLRDTTDISIEEIVSDIYKIMSLAARADS